MVQTSTLIIRQIPLLNQILLYLRQTDLSQLTILSILKSISVRIFLICSSFSSIPVCDFALAFPVRFIWFCPCTWGVILWLALVASHGSFGLPVVFWGFIEFSFIRSMQVVCLSFEWLQTIMTILFAFFKESPNCSPKIWESVSLVNLARSLYSLLIRDNNNFFLIDTKF